MNRANKRAGFARVMDVEPRFDMAAGAFMIAWILTAAFVLCLAVRPAAADENSVGVVIKLSGTVVATRAGNSVPLSLGDFIYVGDRLETAADSALGVTLKDNTLLSLGPHSTFELTGFTLDPVAETFSMGGRIINGSMAVTTGEIGMIAPENVVFETPFGIIGIRGTRFAVTVI